MVKLYKITTSNKTFFLFLPLSLSFHPSKTTKVWLKISVLGTDATQCMERSTSSMKPPWRLPSFPSAHGHRTTRKMSWRSCCTARRRIPQSSRESILQFCRSPRETQTKRKLQNCFKFFVNEVIIYIEAGLSLSWIWIFAFLSFKFFVANELHINISFRIKNRQWIS